MTKGPSGRGFKTSPPAPPYYSLSFHYRVYKLYESLGSTRKMIPDASRSFWYLQILILRKFIFHENFHPNSDFHVKFCFELYSSPRQDPELSLCMRFSFYSKNLFYGLSWILRQKIFMSFFAAVGNQLPGDPVLLSKLYLMDISSTSQYLPRLGSTKKLEAGGKPSTWFPPEGLVEHIF